MTPSKVQNDIIFIGSSRTYVHIDPRIIDSTTGSKSYNLGVDGSNVAFFSMVLNKYLQCHPAPRYVVINADFSCFNLNDKVYNYPDYQEYLEDSIVSASLIPYYSEFKNSLMTRLSLYMQINSKPDDEKITNVLYQFRTIKNKGNSNGGDIRKGFSPQERTWNNELHTIHTFHPSYSSQAFDILRKIIETCQGKDIKVILICSPLHKDYHNIIFNYDVIKDSLNNIAGAYQVPYWIYSDTYISDTIANFYNVEHLNAHGAAIFSKMLGGDIKKYVADSTYVPDMAMRQHDPTVVH